MSIRTAVVALGIALGGAAIAVSAGAGQAAAITPVVAPQDGIYFGVVLDHGETVALQHSPLVGMLNGPLTNEGLFYLDEKSVYNGGQEVDGVVYNDYLEFSGVTAEAAASRSGWIAIALVDPASFAGSPYAIRQVLG